VVQGMELPNFRRGRHLYSAGRPSSWASAHILVLSWTVCQSVQLLTAHTAYVIYIAGRPSVLLQYWCCFTQTLFTEVNTQATVIRDNLKTIYTFTYLTNHAHENLRHFPDI